LKLLQIGIGLLLFEAQSVTVESRKNLAGLNLCTFLDKNFLYLAADFGNDDGIGKCLYRRRSLIQGIHVFADRYRGFHWNRRRFIFFLRFRTGCGAFVFLASRQKNARDQHDRQ
jgi:hypothetical protein